MPQSSNGITAEVIRDIMPPYQLSADLLEATFAAVAPPPPDASPTQRNARIKRLIAEITASKPADAGQARSAAQIVIVRDLADSLATQAHTPGLAMEKTCRLARTVTELLRAADVLDRSLMRHQEHPVPFFGTVTEGAVDTAALDAIWRRTPRSPDPAANPNAAANHDPAPTPDPNPAPPPGSAGQPAPDPRDAAVPPQPPAEVRAAGRPATGTDQSATEAPSPTPEVHSTTVAPAQPDQLPDEATTPAPSASAASEPAPSADAGPNPGAASNPSAGAAPQWTVTRLDEGRGWTREVLPHRGSTKPGNGAAPGSVS